MAMVSIYSVQSHADGLKLQWIIQQSLNKLLSEDAMSALTTMSLSSPTNKSIHSRNVDQEVLKWVLNPVLWTSIYRLIWLQR